MKKSILAAIAILGGTLFIYYILGGFSTVKFELVELDAPYIIAGKSYKGPHDAEEVARVFQELRKLADPQRADSSIVIVSYDSGEDEDNVDLFVAVRLKSYSEIAPYKTIELDANVVYRTKMKGHPTVLPSAEKLLQNAKDLAQTNQVGLGSYSIETYSPDGTIMVEVPVIQ